MKKMILRLMGMCFLTVSVAALAQSGDTMKQDTMQQGDQMKHDNMNADTMTKKAVSVPARSAMTGKCSPVTRTTRCGRS